MTTSALDTSVRRQEPIENADTSISSSGVSFVPGQSSRNVGQMAAPEIMALAEARPPAVPKLLDTVSTA